MKNSLARSGWACLMVIAMLPACSTLQKESSPPVAYYVLDPGPTATPAREPLRAPRRTLIVSPVSAAAGFSTPRMAYVRQPHRLEYFALSEWVDSPARMLAPLIVSRLQQTGLFDAVVSTPSAVSASWRLNVEIVRLQQEFNAGKSLVRLILRAHFVDEKTRRVLGVRELEQLTPAASQDPYGGVVAANQAVSQALEQLAAFALEVAPLDSLIP